MKANEAPEKIYLQVCGDCNDNDCVNCKFEDVEDNVTWCKDKIFEKDIEYVRADAFINKALAYLNEKFYFNNLHYAVENNSFNSMEEMYEDFRKYMEG